MKRRPIFALPEVEIDLKRAMKHYASWRTDGATLIRRKFEETVETISRTPELLPKKVGPVRRVLLARSYYILYFVVEPERVVILAVLDGRRDPQAIARMVAARRGDPRR